MKYKQVQFYETSRKNWRSKNTFKLKNGQNHSSNLLKYATIELSDFFNFTIKVVNKVHSISDWDLNTKLYTHHVTLHVLLHKIIFFRRDFRIPHFYFFSTEHRTDLIFVTKFTLGYLEFFQRAFLWYLVLFTKCQGHKR